MNVNGYRYGFNGMEKDDEIKGSGNSYDFGARIYDPRLGRWLACDPLAVKYTAWSPYHFSADNPILIRDPNGKNWEITVTKSEDGLHTVVRIVVDIAVINSSSNTTYNEIDLQTAIANQIQNAYSLDENVPTDGLYEKTIKVETQVNIRTISDKKDLAANEHLIEIVDNTNPAIANSDPNEITRGKVANFDGRQIYVNEKAVGDIISGVNQKTVPHELGHTGGLYHPHELNIFGIPWNDQHMEDGSQDGNLMYNGLHDGEVGYTGPGNEINQGQVEILIENYNNKEMNKDDIGEY